MNTPLKTLPSAFAMHEVIANNLRYQLDRHQMSPATCANRAGVLPSFLHDILSGKSTNPSVVKLALVARALRISLSQLIEEAGTHSPTLHIVESFDYDRPVCLPPLETNKEHGFEEAHFSERWARKHWGKDAASLAWWRISDTAMQPTMQPGDLVVVNRAITEVLYPGIYVMPLAGRLCARRLQPGTHHVHIHCDNPAYYSSISTPELCEIRGQLVWHARRLDC